MPKIRPMSRAPARRPAVAERPGVVLTGGDFQALGAMRILARKGVPVVLLDSEACIARYSRYRHRFFRSPRLRDTEEYLDFLVQLARGHGLRGWVLLPNSDEAVFLLSKNRTLLQQYYRVPTPGWEVIENVYVKQKTYRIAEQNGIPAPRTRSPKNLDELLAIDLPYPLVIKPSIRDHLYSKLRVKAFRIGDRRQLVETFRKVSSLIDPSEILVQELIPGGARNLYSFCPFYKDGRVVAGIAARRARQHPMDFGHASTYAELVDIPEMRRAAEKFLGLIRYYGIGEVEFMQDPRDGLFKLIEVNPRIWGWHTLAAEAGVDLVYYLYQDAIGEQFEAREPASHAKWVRMITDVPTVFLEIMKGRMKVRDYLQSMKGKKRHAVLDLADPLPSIAEVLMIPYLWIKRGF